MDNSDGDSDANNASKQQSQPAATAPSYGYRPRVLYFSVFTWISLTGGRFTAPFLEDQVHHWTSAQIGLCLALQQVVGSLTTSWAGSAADRQLLEQDALCLVRASYRTILFFCINLTFW
jgi:hypothetical protein